MSTQPILKADAVTGWPGCTLNGHAGTEHVGDEDYSRDSEAWKYVGPNGDATCSCCDPMNGFPCLAAPAPEPITPPGEAGS